LTWSRENGVAAPMPMFPSAMVLAARSVICGIGPPEKPVNSISVALPLSVEL